MSNWDIFGCFSHLSRQNNIMKNLFFGKNENFRAYVKREANLNDENCIHLYTEGNVFEYPYNVEYGNRKQYDLGC